MRKAIQRRLAQIAPLLFHLLSFTWSIRVRGPIPPRECVIAVWHGNMLPMMKYFAYQGWAGLASQSRDGALITQLFERWGYKMIRGSSSKFSKEAWAEMLNAAKTGRMFVSPDGPRGPLHKMKPGAVMTAQRAGVPLWVCRVYPKKRFAIGTNWDKFLIPLLFCKMDMEFEAVPMPEKVGKDEMEPLMLAVEDLLNKPAV
jgi:lysophospholipid acyltransferase (LPLAT)-like uncharacterized protein